MEEQTIVKIYETLGQRIAKARKARSMSQERLASESGVDRSHMGFIEQGRRRPTVSTIARLCYALGMSLEELFKGL